MPQPTEARIVALEAENAALQKRLKDARATITAHERAAKVKNLELDALHYVWCDGGCDTGVHRFDEGRVTHEVVALAVRNTARLVAWYNNYHYKQTKGDARHIEGADALMICYRKWAREVAGKVRAVKLQ